MQQIPDHPAIRHAERFGMDEGPVPICPVCGAECETIFRDKKSLEILGCDVCIDSLDADSVNACFPEVDQ